MPHYHDSMGPGGYVSPVNERFEDPPRPLEICSMPRISKFKREQEEAKHDNTVRCFAKKAGWKLNPELPGLVYGDYVPRKKARR